MKAAALASGLCVLVLAVACNPGGPDPGQQQQLMQRIQTLETNTQQLQQKVDDLRLKARIASSSHLGRSPLEDFFASPEFWENTYDSSKADCAKRCIDALNQHRAACAQKPESQRQACYQEATDNAANCQKGCSGL